MRPATDDYITTFTGIKFRFTDPSHEDVVLEDIAHSLALQCRYNGHCADFYSVAEHCVLVSQWIERRTKSKRLALEGLLHDASEAYLCDVPRPIKPMLDPLYHSLEYRVERAIARRFNLTLPWNEFVKEADVRICRNEHAALFEEQHGPCDWHLPHPDPLDETEIMFYPWTRAKRAFLHTFNRLTGA